MGRLREAPLKKLQGLFGHCPNGGGGLNACPNGLGHLFREEVPQLKWAFFGLWGGKDGCQDGLGLLCLCEPLSFFQRAFPQAILRVAPDTIYYHFRKLTTLQNGKNSARKKVPQSARLSEGGGAIAIWAMPE